MLLPWLLLSAPLVYAPTTHIRSTEVCARAHVRPTGGYSLRQYRSLRFPFASSAAGAAAAPPLLPARRSSSKPPFSNPATTAASTYSRPPSDESLASASASQQALPAVATEAGAPQVPADRSAAGLGQPQHHGAKVRPYSVGVMERGPGGGLGHLSAVCGSWGRCAPHHLKLGSRRQPRTALSEGPFGWRTRGKT